MVEHERVRRLEALFAAHARAVRAYALRRIDPATADDIVSEVFVIAFRRLEEIPDQPLPWLLATARRVLANHRRAEGRRHALTAQLGVLHAGVWGEEPDGATELLGAVARLRESDREILLLVAWEDLDPADRGGGVGMLASSVCGATASGPATTRGRDGADQARERYCPTTHGGNEMTDLLVRLRAVNPIRTCDPPALEEVWRKLQRDNQAPDPEARPPERAGRGAGRGGGRVFSWTRLRVWHVGLGLAVVVPVLVAAVAIVLLGHHSGRPVGSVIRPAHRKPTRLPSTAIDAALSRGIHPVAPKADQSLPILGSSRARSLASFRGRVVVLNVFASWCAPCRDQTTQLEQAQVVIADQGATVLGVTYEDKATATEAFVRRQHVTYPVRDPTGQFVRAFGISGVP